MDRKRRLFNLAIGLIVVGVIANLLGYCEIRTPLQLPRLPLVPGFALTFCELVLLALWMVYSPAPIWRRMIVTTLSLTGLEMLFDFEMRSQLFLMPCMAMVMIFVSLLAVRWFGFGLAGEVEVSDPPRESSRFQFSIRNLMALTVLVALLSSGVRSLKDSPALSLIGQTAIWSACFVGVGMLAILTMLVRKRPLVWCLATYVISPTLGACFAYAIDEDLPAWIYILLIMLLYPTFMLGSLAVVRSTGIRLVLDSPDRGISSIETPT